MIAVSSVCARDAATFSRRPTTSAATRQHAEHEHPRRCAERRERAAEQHDDEQPEREERPVLCRVADARELHRRAHRRRPRPTPDAATASTRRRAHRHAERERGRLALTRRSEAQPDRRACEREVAERGERRSARARARSAARRSARRPRRRPCEPPRNQAIDCSAEGDEPRDDPRRGGEPGAAAAARRRRRRAPPRRPPATPPATAATAVGAPACEQMRCDDGADRDEGALGERRQAGDADREREPDRGAREVEPVARSAVRASPTTSGASAATANAAIESVMRGRQPACSSWNASANARHSTASCVSVRARQANSARPSASGSTSR